MRVHHRLSEDPRAVLEEEQTPAGARWVEARAGDDEAAARCRRRERTRSERLSGYRVDRRSASTGGPRPRGPIGSMRRAPSSPNVKRRSASSRSATARLPRRSAHCRATGRRIPHPRLACGMIGSRQGWQEAPYVECPGAARRAGGEAGARGGRRPRDRARRLRPRRAGHSRRDARRGNADPRCPSRRCSGNAGWCCPERTASGRSPAAAGIDAFASST